jgi:hypothetical protein
MAAAAAPGSAERQARGGAASASGNAVSARSPPPPCRESAARLLEFGVRACVRLVPGSLLWWWWWWVFCCSIGVGGSIELLRGRDREDDEQTTAVWGGRAVVRMFHGWVGGDCSPLRRGRRGLRFSGGPPQAAAATVLFGGLGDGLHRVTQVPAEIAVGIDVFRCRDVNL